MRFAILCSEDGWYFQDLKRAAAADFELVAVGYSQLFSQVGTTDDVRVHCRQLTLNEFDAVIVRAMPPGSLEQVIFRMDALAQLEATGTVVVNPPKTIEAAVDKYLGLAKLQSAGLPVPPTIVCQTCDAAMDAFEKLGQDVVIKPLFGSEGRGIARVNDEAMAVRAFKLLEQLGGVIYVQQFVPHDGSDMRILLVGDKLFSIRRSNAGDWRTNVSRGATVEAIVPDDEVVHLARKAAKTLNAGIAGVDLVRQKDGQIFVLEVNSSPGWKAVAKTTSSDIARTVLEYVRELVLANRVKGTKY